MTSTESITSDKEAVNVARSSAKTENWHVDGSGGFDIGIVKLGVSAGGSGTTTETAQDSVQHITEATKKSAHSLKTLHKIEVRGVSETLIQNRMTRVIKNPYSDRALSLNVFQLIKHFSVLTHLTEIRPALIAEVKGLVFDKEFVLSYSDFLRDQLIDPSLVDDLATAIQGAKPIFSSGGQVAAQHVARLALRYLFDQPNVFKMPSPVRFPSGQSIDPNLPETSFDANPTRPLFNLDTSALGESLRLGLSDIFTTLNMFFKIYREMRDTAVPQGTPPLLEQEDNAIWLATALVNEIGDKWKTFVDNKQDALAVLDEDDLTEIFRRLSGFIAIVKDRLLGLLAAAADDQKAILDQAQAAFVLYRLIKHLVCNENYYIQQFLVYIAAKTNNQTIIDFVNQLIDATGRISPEIPDVLRRVFDVNRSFVSKQVILVPSVRPLTAPDLVNVVRPLSDDPAAEFSFDDITPTIADIEVPADGIHLETAPGLCVLPDVPPQAGNKVEFTVQNASLTVDPC
jgi:hypothetical protein